jgi:hypothetical protein
MVSKSLDNFHERQQLPLKLAWAMTIHKSQGLTLPKAWIDIGPTEKAAGITYVPISRSIDSCIIEPMTFERFKKIKNSFQFQFRLNEEEQLSRLASSTKENFH